MPAVRTRRGSRRHPGTLYVVPGGGGPGLKVRGNINLWAQPVIRNPNGSYSTVKSTSYTCQPGWPCKGKLEVLMTSVWPGLARVAEGDAIWRHFVATGQHLGMFDTAAHATQYANLLHIWFVQNAKWFVPPRKK